MVVRVALLAVCVGEVGADGTSECELRDGASSVAASYAYFEQSPGYLPGCVLSDMDGSAQGGCVHYASLAEAVTRCDALVVPPRGCAPTDASGQKNGCTCAGVTKEGDGARPYRLGAFPLVQSGGPVSWQRSAAACSGAATAFVLSVAVGLVLYLGVGGALRARSDGAGQRWVVPHRKQWLHLYGLCRDGVSFATGGARLSGKGAPQEQAGLAQPLTAGSRSATTSTQKRYSGGEKAKKKGRGGSSNSGKERREAHRAGKEAASGPIPTAGGSGESDVRSDGAGVHAHTSQAGDGGRWVRVPA
jgi:hypothetical protein